MNQAETAAIVEKIHSNVDVYRKDMSTLSKAQKHELFQLNMVLAVGGIRLHRDGHMTQHPFGFFTAALEAQAPSEYGFCTVEDVECLLLIGLFGLFYNIRTRLNTNPINMPLTRLRLLNMGTRTPLCSPMH